MICKFNILLIAQTKLITSISGNGINGFSGDGGSPTSAKINSPAALTFDTAGNLYVADQGNIRVRKITFTDVMTGITEMITTVAGTGIAGYSTTEDGGPATAARLSATISGVAVDSSGNLYLGDTDNYRVRMVQASSGNIVTLAGTGTATTLSPTYLRVLGSTLYLDDSGNYRLKTVDLLGLASVTVTANTTTTVSVSSASVSSGQSVTLTAAVSNSSVSTPVPTGGTVQFVVDGTDFGSPTNLLNGTASLSTSTLPRGNHTITARYTGDNSRFLTSASANSASVAVGVTTTTVSSNNLSTNYGQSATFTATVSSKSATGTVQFFDGSDLLTTATVSGGTATYSTSSLHAGTHLISAIYSGDTNNQSSTSASISQVITKAALTATVTASRVYGSSPFTTVTSYSGFVLGQNSSVLSGTLTVLDNSLTTANVGISQNQLTASGLLSADYAVSYVDAGLTINKKAMTITVLGESKTYGDQLSLNGTDTNLFSVDGLLNGNTVTSVNLISDGAAASAGVADSPYILSASAAQGTGLANYDITYINSTVTVKKAHLTVSADPAFKTYDGQAFTAHSYTFTGFVNQWFGRFER